eukprot:11097436-Karenia_brevis.AAC.1
MKTEEKIYLKANGRECEWQCDPTLGIKRIRGASLEAGHKLVRPIEWGEAIGNESGDEDVDVEIQEGVASKRLGLPKLRESF